MAGHDHWELESMRVDSESSGKGKERRCQSSWVIFKIAFRIGTEMIKRDERAIEMSRRLNGKNERDSQ